MVSINEIEKISAILPNPTCNKNLPKQELNTTEALPAGKAGSMREKDLLDVHSKRDPTMMVRDLK
ncbi:hypothetical protein [Methanobrevibacter sp.]|uniref:hypothetical protein n=1 Tax=Methanobrevibacter sp. TaxID=66852 RepID=UPI003865D439